MSRRARHARRQVRRDSPRHVFSMGGRSSARSRQLYCRRLRIEPLEERQLLSITVNTLTDEADGSLADGDISLRDAIALAPAGATIDFASPLTAGGPATVHLTLGEIAVKRKLSIVGPGANLLTLDAFGGHSRIFNID